MSKTSKERGTNRVCLGICGKIISYKGGGRPNKSGYCTSCQTVLKNKR